MTWSETTRRWRAMREIEDLFVDYPGSDLPWNPDLAELFGDRDGLVVALRYRWRLAREAQLDPYAPELAYEEQRLRTARREAVLQRILDAAARVEQGRDRAVA